MIIPEGVQPGDMFVMHYYIFPSDAQTAPEVAPPAAGRPGPQPVVTPSTESHEQAAGAVEGERETG